MPFYKTTCKLIENSNREGKRKALKETKMQFWLGLKALKVIEVIRIDLCVFFSRL